MLYPDREMLIRALLDGGETALRELAAAWGVIVEDKRTAPTKKAITPDFTPAPSPSSKDR